MAMPQFDHLVNICIAESGENCQPTACPNCKSTVSTYMSISATVGFWKALRPKRCMVVNLGTSVRFPVVVSNVVADCDGE